MSGKNILIFQQRQWGFTIGASLAKKFQEEQNHLFAITMKNTAFEYVTTQKDVKYEKIFNYDDIIYTPLSYEVPKDLTLETICKGLGIATVWPLVSCVRKLTKNYGEKFYYSFRKRASDEYIIAYIKSVYTFLKDILINNKIDLVIMPVHASFVHVVANLLCKQNNIKIVSVTDSKVEGVFLFANDTFFREGEFFNVLEREQHFHLEKVEQHLKKEKKKNEKEFIKLKREYSSVGDFFLKEMKFFYSLILLLKKFAFNYTKAVNTLGPDIDFPTPYTMVRDHFVYKYQRWKTRKYTGYSEFNDNKKYVYFPLQFQPEAQIDLFSPYFNNQIETARLVAQSLPGSLCLVVKEHPAMIGYRGVSYYEKLLGLPNVKLIRPDYNGHYLISKAEMIIAPVSTTIFEGAVFNKPVIQLGNYGLTEKLPDVHVHTDLTSLPQKILDVLEKGFDTKSHESHLKKWIGAVYETGFELDYTKLWYDQDSRQELFDEYWEHLKKEVCL